MTNQYIKNVLVICYICLMKNLQERLMRLHNKLRASPKGVSRQELTLYIFEAPAELNEDQIKAFCKKKRTLFFDLLDLLRTGGYLNDKNGNKIQTYPCVIECDEKTYLYKYAEGSKMPIFHDLEEDELLALPFLLGVLLNYQFLEIFNKLYLELLDKYALKDDEVNKGVSYTAGVKDFMNDEYIKHLIVMQNSIVNNHKVKFNYQPVSLMSKRYQVEVYPLKILLHEGLFYLWAIKSLNSETILSFRLDRIDLAQEIESIPDVDFNATKLRNTLIEEKNILEHIIGVVPPKDINDKPTIFKLKFHGWAAALVKSAPIHSTMEIIEEQVNENYLIATMKVYNTFEVSFLLGRYRDYCEVLEPENFKYDSRKEKETTETKF